MKFWKQYLGGILVGLLLSGLIRMISLNKNEQTFKLITVTPNLTPEPSVTTKLIKVHVAGEVTQTGVYSLPEGATVLDAINAAHGPTARAREDLLNLAAVLSDGQRLYIPSLQEEQASLETESRLTEIDVSKPININTASQEELEDLPGIGKVRAEAIIAFRTQNGYFLTIEDILKVNGIGDATFAQLKPLITVSP
ncbi:MAG: helix-hairpin-helix domain-containing protein [Anaerolineaceae bacterium]|nr:helix-hairpin-helix domain-containing protein [Anaerolineaceae bacterium]